MFWFDAEDCSAAAGRGAECAKLFQPRGNSLEIGIARVDLPGHFKKLFCLIEFAQLSLGVGEADISGARQWRGTSGLLEEVRGLAPFLEFQVNLRQQYARIRIADSGVDGEGQRLDGVVVLLVAYKKLADLEMSCTDAGVEFSGAAGMQQRVLEIAPGFVGAGEIEVSEKIVGMDFQALFESGFAAVPLAECKTGFCEQIHGPRIIGMFLNERFKPCEGNVGLAGGDEMLGSFDISAVSGSILGDLVSPGIWPEGSHALGLGKRDPSGQVLAEMPLGTALELPEVWKIWRVGFSGDHLIDQFGCEIVLAALERDAREPGFGGGVVGIKPNGLLEGRLGLIEALKVEEPISTPPVRRDVILLERNRLLDGVQRVGYVAQISLHSRQVIPVAGVAPVKHDGLLVCGLGKGRQAVGIVDHAEFGTSGGAAGRLGDFRMALADKLRKGRTDRIWMTQGRRRGDWRLIELQPRADCQSGQNNGGKRDEQGSGHFAMIWAKYGPARDFLRRSGGGTFVMIDPAVWKPAVRKERSIA